MTNSYPTDPRFYMSETTHNTITGHAKTSTFWKNASKIALTSELDISGYPIPRIPRPRQLAMSCSTARYHLLSNGQDVLDRMINGISTLATNSLDMVNREDGDEEDLDNDEDEEFGEDEFNNDGDEDEDDEELDQEDEEEEDFDQDEVGEEELTGDEEEEENDHEYEVVEDEEEEDSFDEAEDEEEFDYEEDDEYDDDEYDQDAA